MIKEEMKLLLADNEDVYTQKIKRILNFLKIYDSSQGC